MRSLLDTAWTWLGDEGRLVELDCHKLARETGCSIDRLHALGLIAQRRPRPLEMSRLSEAMAVLLGAATGGAP
jgi:hypothetical protein